MAPGCSQGRLVEALSSQTRGSSSAPCLGPEAFAPLWGPQNLVDQRKTISSLQRQRGSSTGRGKLLPKSYRVIYSYFFHRLINYPALNSILTLGANRTH